jgi:hypothetical protein
MSANHRSDRSATLIGWLVVACPASTSVKYKIAGQDTWRGARAAESGSLLIGLPASPRTATSGLNRVFVSGSSSPRGSFG